MGALDGAAPSEQEKEEKNMKKIALALLVCLLLVMTSAMALAYAPLLLVAGVLVGALNCLLTRALFTALPQTARRSRWKRNPFRNKNIS